MDAKLFVYGFCLLAVIAGTSFWSYAMDIDEVQKELVLARQQHNALEDSLKQTKAWLVARKEAAALIAAAAVMKEQNDGLHGEVQAINKQRFEVARNYMSTIERARAETPGMFLPEVVLTTGACLKNVKIQSVTEELSLLQHSEGVAKIDTQLLPAELRDRLRYGFNPDGIGALSKQVVGSAPSLDTSTSDRLMRMGASGSAATPKPQEGTSESQPGIASAQAPAAAVPAAGQRESLGRVYVPGKGWQRAGAGGFVAPPTLTPTTTTTTTTTENPDAVSKVKSRMDTSTTSGK